MRYVSWFEVGGLTKPKKINPLKKAVQWGMGMFIKGQIGSLLGTGLASMLPGLAISGALLIASYCFYQALCQPGSESIAPMVLGLAMGVLSHV